MDSTKKETLDERLARLIAKEEEVQQQIIACHQKAEHYIATHQEQIAQRCLEGCYESDDPRDSAEVQAAHLQAEKLADLQRGLGKAIKETKNQIHKVKVDIRNRIAERARGALPTAFSDAAKALARLSAAYSRANGINLAELDSGKLVKIAQQEYEVMYLQEMEACLNNFDSLKNTTSSQGA